MRAARPDPSRALPGQRSGVERALDLAAAGLLALFLMSGVSAALLRAGSELYQAAHAHESLAEARARVYGEAYTRAIDQIRRELPAGDGYLLVEGGDPGTGGAYWVRYDLAPRRAVYLGRLDELTSGARIRRRLAANLRHVVVAFDTREPPRLYDRYRFIQEIDRRAGEGSRAR
jgi:hypothetical protein